MKLTFGLIREFLNGFLVEFRLMSSHFISLLKSLESKAFWRSETVSRFLGDKIGGVFGTQFSLKASLMALVFVIRWRRYRSKFTQSQIAKTISLFVKIIRTPPKSEV